MKNIYFNIIIKSWYILFWNNKFLNFFNLKVFYGKIIIIFINQFNFNSFEYISQNYII